MPRIALARDRAILGQRLKFHVSRRDRFRLLTAAYPLDLMLAVGRGGLGRHRCGREHRCGSEDVSSPAACHPAECSSVGCLRPAIGCLSPAAANQPGLPRRGRRSVRPARRPAATFVPKQSRTQPIKPCQQAVFEQSKSWPVSLPYPPIRGHGLRSFHGPIVDGQNIGVCPIVTFVKVKIIGKVCPI